MIDDETTKYINVIESIVGSIGCRVYVELGVNKGHTFSRICPIVQRAIGVDIVDARKTKEGEFFLGTTDHWFSTLDKNFKADVIFIDADHTYEQVLKDFNNSLSILSTGGLIFIHDTSPNGKKYTQEQWSSNSYKVVFDIEKMNDLWSMTLPCDNFGLTIISRKKRF